MSDTLWPRMYFGQWCASPLVALGRWADKAEPGYPMVAVPVELLIEAARWRECSDRHMLTHDEDGPLRDPMEIVCRRQQGHDAEGNPEHVRQHHNGYVGWVR